MGKNGRVRNENIRIRMDKESLVWLFIYVRSIVVEVVFLNKPKKDYLLKISPLNLSASF